MCRCRLRSRIANRPGRRRRAGPDLLVGNDEPGHEVLVFAGWLPGAVKTTDARPCSRSGGGRCPYDVMHSNAPPGWTSRGLHDHRPSASVRVYSSKNDSITTARGRPRRLAICNLACHDGRQFGKRPYQRGQLTIVSVAVVLERLFGAALSKYRRPDVAVRPVQRTIRIRIDRHAGGFPLLGVGLMSDELAGATELQCFGRSGRRY